MTIRTLKNLSLDEINALLIYIQKAYNELETRAKDLEKKVKELQS